MNEHGVRRQDYALRVQGLPPGRYASLQVFALHALLLPNAQISDGSRVRGGDIVSGHDFAGLPHLRQSRQVFQSRGRGRSVAAALLPRVFADTGGKHAGRASTLPRQGLRQHAGSVQLFSVSALPRQRVPHAPPRRGPRVPVCTCQAVLWSSPPQQQQQQQAPGPGPGPAPQEGQASRCSTDPQRGAVIFSSGSGSGSSCKTGIIVKIRSSSSSGSSIRNSAQLSLLRPHRPKRRLSR